MWEAIFPTERCSRYGVCVIDLFENVIVCVKQTMYQPLATHLATGVKKLGKAKSLEKRYE
jgi:hypothetical protein